MKTFQYDAEIVYLENKERDQLQQIEAITREIGKHDNFIRQGNEQVRTFKFTFPIHQQSNSIHIQTLY